jgi:hypothetical protein
MNDASISLLGKRGGLANAPWTDLFAPLSSMLAHCCTMTVAPTGTRL